MLVTVGFILVALCLAEFSKLQIYDLKHSVMTGSLFHEMYVVGYWCSFSVGIWEEISAFIMTMQTISIAVFFSI